VLKMRVFCGQNVTDVAPRPQPDALLSTANSRHD
jgi:hypothetical protein